MACNSCAKPFGLLRKEKGCPGCGFSYCTKCLEYKMFLPKLNAEAKVCVKCKRSTASEKPAGIEPPDAYYKRLEKIHPQNSATTSNSTSTPPTKDDEIQERLKKLKEGREKKNTEQEIADRLKNIKGEVRTASDEEIQERLARLRGVPVSVVQSQPVLPAPDRRTEQEQADDLMKQYLEQTKIDTKYKDEFDTVIDSMSGRLQRLKGDPGPGQGFVKTLDEPRVVDPATPDEDEEELVRKVLEKYKAETLKEDAQTDDPQSPDLTELPFCEICNSDASRRCLGCRYLFCKRCFNEHRDDDDECDRYEEFTATTTSV